MSGARLARSSARAQLGIRIEAVDLDHLGPRRAIEFQELCDPVELAGRALAAAINHVKCHRSLEIFELIGGER